MSVPQDEDGSSADLNVTQMSSSKSLENVSYIGKDQAGSMASALGGDSRGFSDAVAESSPKDMPNPMGVRASSTATTARASSLDSGPSSTAGGLFAYDQELGRTPTQNPLFEDKYS